MSNEVIVNQLIETYFDDLFQMTFNQMKRFIKEKEPTKYRQFVDRIYVKYKMKQVEEERYS